MRLTRVAWSVWALLPVVALTYHYGPGQRLFSEDRAARVLETAQRAQADAALAQDAAYEKHLAAILARDAARENDDPALQARAQRAVEEENAAYALAASEWKRTAEALTEALTLMEDSAPEAQQRVRLARARALVRSGDIGAGANELEDIVDWHGAVGRPDADIALQAREELATAYYYGARLLRLAGRPSAEWREVSGRARQNYRYLAEHAGLNGNANAMTVAHHQMNGELVLNLEQSAMNELYAAARPRESPQCDGNGNGLGKLKARGRGRPRGEDPGAGAGFNGEIGRGW
ncbi:MAG: hypothetical protein KF684_05290 [Phycisphaeraceae bacterium]|nr:hypothetical protein [Phycisphaeraceae bacterium]